MTRYKIRNWEKFQHFKDRRPPWVKLYRDILDNADWFYLSPVAAKALVMLWLVASESDGRLPDIDTLAWRLRMKNEEMESVIETLIDSEFVAEDHSDSAPAKSSQEIAKKNGFGSRYISDALKVEVMARDGGVCQSCGVAENLEFDHIHPVSKGGESTIDNLQILCRSCNRSKRAKSAAPSVASKLRQAEQGGCAKRSLEKSREETETETEAEAEAEGAAAQPETTCLKFSQIEDAIREQWNAAAATRQGWSKCTKRPSGEVGRLLAARCRDPDWVADYPTALEAMTRFQWMKRGKFATILRPDTVRKILDGEWDDRQRDVAIKQPGFDLLDGFE